MIKRKIEKLDLEFVRTLAKNTAALAQDGFKFFELSFNNSLPSPWKEYAMSVREFTKQRDPKRLRRFRRLIPPEKIVKLADMIYALLSEENYNNFTHPKL